MFSGGYFAAGYFAPEYFGPVGIVVPPVVPSPGGGHSRPVFRRVSHKPNPVTIDAGKRHVLATFEWVTTSGGIVLGGGATVETWPAPVVAQAYTPDLVPTPGAADTMIAAAAEATGTAPRLQTVVARAFQEDEDELILLGFFD